MSFQRIAAPGRKKKGSVRKKPQWDDSVNDLTAYKASPDEITQRKEAHKSKNHISVKLEKMRKENRKMKQMGCEAQQFAIMKEILYDHEQLQNVIAKSDKMLAVVKDLFGDDPKRFTGFPNVTSAPRPDLERNGASGLVASVPDIYTRSEKLSDSVMNQSALNDVDDDTATESDEEDESDSEMRRPGQNSFESALNLQRFQQYIQEEEKRSDHLDPPTLVALQKKAQSGRTAGGGEVAGEQDQQKKIQPQQLVQLLSSIMNEAKAGDGDPNLNEQMQKISLLTAALSGQDTSFKTPPRSQQGYPPPQNPSMQPTAINNTDKIQKTRKQTASVNDSNSSENLSINDMRKVLHELESEIAAYEHQTGRNPQAQTGQAETFSGYTVALVSAVSRLTKYLKETDLRIRTEITLREQLTQDVYQLRAIIDALATDIIMTQEEYAKLYAENQRYKENTVVRISSLEAQVLELRNHTLNQSPKTNLSCLVQHQQHQPQEAFLGDKQKQNVEKTDRSQKSGGSKTSTPVDFKPDASPKSLHSSARSVSEEPPQQPPLPSNAAAVMLSPPVRKTRVATNARLPAEPSKRQESLVNVPNLISAGTKNSADPPSLTQALPVMNKVSVPRPIPLVQSNVPQSISISDFQGAKGFNKNVTASSHDSMSFNNNVAASSQESQPPVQVNNLNDLVRLEGQTQSQLHQLQEMAVEEALKNPQLQSLMQTQIAELNRQQEEARKRLRSLLANQKVQQRHLQQQLGPDVILNGDSPPYSILKQYQEQTVSPPISPISQSPEQSLFQRVAAGPGREITVSLPMVDLEVSSGSL